MQKVFKINNYNHKLLCKKVPNSAKFSSKDIRVFLGNTYIPSEIEKNYADNNYFHSRKKPNKIYSLILPPPNITGTLHLGHALAVTIQDVLIRWNRMRGMQTIWIPGIDHAGIATQVIVEKKIWKENRITRHDLGREKFQKEVWKWKEEKANTISRQLRQIGASLDWSRQMFTMDPTHSNAVTEAFIKLYECGLIYRSDYLVNWSCVLRSAVSDIEVEHLQISGPTHVSVPTYEQPVQFGVLTKFAYKLCDSDEEIVVATTRPETMLGDTAIAVHPKDQRYGSSIGRMCWHPFRNEKIPIISDEIVDPQFGTGAVKVTPAHDHIDFNLGKRHNLNLLQVIDEEGNVSCGQFKNLRRFDARNIIINELQKLNLFRGNQDHEMTVPICSRSKDVIEFMLKPQWFLKCENMASRALNDVMEGRLEIEPKNFVKDWTTWLENIRDWCISRQLWWGHRIPIYFCHIVEEPNKTCYIAAKDLQTAKSKAALNFGCHSDDIVAIQDEDVLDTWFSSALLPFSAFGWPQQTNDLQQYYPLSLMETGHDILFFWVARMVMLGTELTEKLPFSKILLHGIICDAHGRKMSKSLGNVIAPEDVIFGTSLQALENKSQESYNKGVLTKEEFEKGVHGQKKMFPEGIPDCGSDALRFTLCSHNIKNRFINFDVQECKINKYFGNKIWQAVKFTNKWMDSVSKAQTMGEVKYEFLVKLDKWILSRLSFMVESVNQGLETYEFHTATNALKSFLYYDLCDVYLETTKRGLQLVDSSIAQGHCWTLSTCFDVGLRCMHPFMPRLSTHLHERIFRHPFVIQELDFPTNLPWRDTGIENDIDQVKEIIVSIRRLKNMFNVTSKHKPKVFLVTQSPRFTELCEAIEDLSGCDKITVGSEIESIFASETVSDNVCGDVRIHLLVPEDLRNAFEVDIQKLEKKRTKLIAELHKIKKITSTDGYKLNASAKVQEGYLRKIMNLEEKISRIDYMKNFSRV